MCGSLTIEEAGTLLDAGTHLGHGGAGDSFAVPYAPGVADDSRPWLQRIAGGRRPALNLHIPEPGAFTHLVADPPVLMGALRGQQALSVLDGAFVQAVVTAAPRRAPSDSWLPLAWHEQSPRPAPILAGHASGVHEQLFRSLDAMHHALRDEDLVPDEPVRARDLPEGWILVEPPEHWEYGRAHSARLAGRIVVLADARLAEIRDEASREAERSRTLMRQLRAQARDVLVACLSEVGQRPAGD